MRNFLIVSVIFLILFFATLKSGFVSVSLASPSFVSETIVWQDLKEQLDKAKETLESLLKEIRGQKKTEEKSSAGQEESDLTLPTPSSEELSFLGDKNYYEAATEHERQIIDVVRRSLGAVVSVVIYKDVPMIEQYFDSGDDFFKDIPPEFRPFFDFKIPRYREKGTEKKQIGGGSGFIISEDGLVLTNKHVVVDTNAEYVVVTNDNKEYKAKVLARDPVQDLAVLKINASGLHPLPLGDSNKNVLGQTVIAIGNALGEFKNTVSVGVISGLGRKVQASGGSINEIIEGAIQTDAAINQGNSGGPLLNLRGEVIGINTAMAFGAENIGFAIPINKAKKAIQSVKTTGKIAVAYLGVRYQIITPTLKEKNNLPVDYGAWIMGDKNKNEPAVVSGSAAEKAGLKEGDIILEVDGKKIDAENTLSSLIQKHSVGDTVVLKIIRGDKIIDIKVILGEI